jgi:hypothetical protein
MWRAMLATYGENMERQTSRVRICAAAGFLVLTAAVAGCNDHSNPVAPSDQSRGSGAATAVAPSPTSLAPGAPANLSPTDLTKRGWTCFKPPVPDGRIVCGRPNQSVPSVPAPDDRPATFTFFIFDPNGRYVGTELLLRTDLYNGQLCESTGEKYFFAEAIGYYECIHTTGN